MNPKKLVQLSNLIGIIAIVLLLYWIFTFITIQVFDLKIFREKITQSFYMSVMGILALMIGALIINVMLNLTRIAQKHNQDELETKTGNNIKWLLLLSFPILLGVLFGGDYLNSKQKENKLVNSAESIIGLNNKKNQHFLNYIFNEDWIIETSEILEILSKTDENFPHVSILVKDSIKSENVFLGFNSNYYGNTLDTISPKKKYFIRKTSKSEREYLNKVFDEKYEKYMYKSHEGKYEMFYPIIEGQNCIVIFFSENPRYGKIGR